MNEEMLTPDEARRVSLSFIQSTYHGAKVTIDQAKLVTKGAPVYHVEGSIKMPSRSLLGRFAFPPEKFTVKVQVHAMDGSILDYELS